MIPTLSTFRRLDSEFVKRGHPATSMWWLDTLERFYESDKRILLLRVGRRGGMTTTLARLALACGPTACMVVMDRENVHYVNRIIKVDSFPNEEPNVCSGRQFFESPPRGCDTFIGEGVDSWFLYPSSEWTNGTLAEAHDGRVRAVVRAVSVAKRAIFTVRRCRDSFVKRLLSESDVMLARAASWEANPSLTKEMTRRLEPIEQLWRENFAALDE